MATEVASLEARFSANTSGFDRGMADVQGGIDTTSGRLQSMGRTISGVGQRMVLFSLASVGSIALVVNKAAEFESAFAGVEKTVDASESELAELESTIRTMATDANNPLSGLDDAHVTLAEIMETAGQLGVSKENLVDFTQTMGEMALATNLTADEAATLTARFANVTGMDFTNVDRFGASLVELGNNSAATESEILNMAQRLSAAGTAAGLSEPDILAFAASLSSVGLSAELGGGSMSRFLNKITTAVDLGGPELDRLAETAGLTSDGFKTAFEDDAAGAISVLLEKMGEMNQGDRLALLEDMGLSGSEAADVIGRISNNTDLLNDSLDLSATAWADNTALTDEANQRFATTESQVNLAKNRMTELAIVMGGILLPAFNNILDIISPLIGRFAKFAEANPQLVSGLAAVALAVGGLGAAFVVLGPIISGVGAALAFGGAALTGALVLAGGALAALLSPIGLVVAAIGVLIGVVIHLSGGFDTASQKVISFVNGAIVMAQAAFESAKETIVNIISDLTSFGTSIDDLSANLSGLVSGALSTAQTAFDNVKTSVLNVILLGLNPLELVVGRLESAVTGPLNNVKSAFTTAFGPISDVIGEVIGLIEGIPGAVSDAANAIGGLNTTGEGAGGLFGSGLGPNFDPIGGIRGLSSGTHWTGSGSTSEPAGIVHRQEAVVPAGGMQVIPSPRGLMVEGTVGASGGGGGRTVVIQHLEVNGVEDAQKLLDEIERAARMRAR